MKCLLTLMLLLVISSRPLAADATTTRLVQYDMMKRLFLQYSDGFKVYIDSICCRKCSIIRPNNRIGLKSMRPHTCGLKDWQEGLR
jgi:hypothetical protein